MPYEVGESFQVNEASGEKRRILKISKVDPKDSKALKKKRSKRPAGFPWLWFLPSYLCFMVPLLTIFGIVLQIVQVVLATRRKRIWGLYALLLGPILVWPTAFFGMGVVDYFQNDGRLQGSGMPGFGYGSLHPEYRCRRVSGGCVVDGSEGLRQGPYNFALTTMIKTFGPMEGSFTGAYPSKDEAWAALKKSKQQLSVAEIKQAFEEKSIPRRLKGLFAKDVRQLRGGYQMDSTAHYAERWRPYAVFGETLIIAGGWQAVLIDRGTGRAYAYYRFYEHIEELERMPKSGM
jgi:hypothetical protein